MAEKKKLPVITYVDADINPDRQNSSYKGPVCSGCALEKKSRIVGQGDTAADIMLVSESPSWTSVCNRKHFYGRGGGIIRSTLKQLIDTDERMGSPLKLKTLKRYETYAVQCECEKEKVSKAVVDRCSIYLHSAIRSRNPKIIVTFGANALRSVGIKAQKFNEARGRLLHTTIGGETYLVLPTFSTNAILAKTGIFNLFRSDIIRALKIASGIEQIEPLSIEELTKNHRIPKTIEEVKAICQEILEYAGNSGDPKNWAIAVDTETNTLYAFKKEATVLCISFAWDDGLSTAIPLWHPDSPLDVNEVLPYVKEVLESPKPKVFHNAAYDLSMLELACGLKVNNVRWDTMLGEHLLNENMSGNYSLKVISRTYFPTFTGYADKVHDEANSLQAEGIGDGTEDVYGGTRRKSKAKGMEEAPDFAIKASELKQYLGISNKKQKGLNDAGYLHVDFDLLLQYAAIDTDLTRRLLKHQFKRFTDEGSGKVKGLMQSLCIPASRALGQIMYGGIHVDMPYVDQLYDHDLKDLIEESEKEIRQHWDGGPNQKEPKEFMINSPSDIGYILFNKGALIDIEGDRQSAKNRKTFLINEVVGRNEKSGQWKTDKKTLNALAKSYDCRFARAVLNYRGAFKAKNTFIADIKAFTDDRGYIHPNYNLHGTATGRLSSNNPNAQNWAGMLAGVNIKKIFIPDDPDNELFVNLDYKGAEIRIFAAYSKDTALIQALNDGLDAHCFFAARIYDEPYEDLEAVRLGVYTGDPARGKYLKQMRDNVKRVVFGILYGAGARKIAETAGITYEEAQEVIALMFSMFPSIKQYVDSTKALIDKLGYVETFDGRRRRFPLAWAGSFFRSEAHRQGVNMRIQAQSSNIVLDRVIELNEHMHELGGRLLLTVHDSIGATVAKKYVHQLPEFLKYYCVERVAELCPWLPVAFECDVGVGPNYGEITPLESYLKDQDVKINPEELEEKDFDDEIITEFREEAETSNELGSD